MQEEMLLNSEAFVGVNWKSMEVLDEVQQEYDFFLNNFEIGMKKLVPMYKIREERQYGWFHGRPEMAKKETDGVWRKRKKTTQKSRRDHK